MSAEKGTDDLVANTGVPSADRQTEAPLCEKGVCVDSPEDLGRTLKSQHVKEMVLLPLP